MKTETHQALKLFQNNFVKPKPTKINNHNAGNLPKFETIFIPSIPLEETTTKEIPPIKTLQIILVANGEFTNLLQNPTVGSSRFF